MKLEAVQKYRLFNSWSATMIAVVIIPYWVVTILDAIIADGSIYQVAQCLFPAFNGFASYCWMLIWCIGCSFLMPLDLPENPVAYWFCLIWSVLIHFWQFLPNPDKTGSFFIDIHGFLCIIVLIVLVSYAVVAVGIRLVKRKNVLNSYFIAACLTFLAINLVETLSVIVSLVTQSFSRLVSYSLENIQDFIRSH